jgi:hypothetical protein
MSEAMTPVRVLIYGAMFVACDFPRPANVGGSDAAVDATPVDAAVTDGPTRCDPKSRFGTPVPIPELATTGFAEVGPRLSPDELTVYFYGYELDGEGTNVYTAQRNTVTEAFRTPVLSASLSSADLDYDVSISSDELTLWLASSRIPNQGIHLFVASRRSTLHEFNRPELAAAVNAADTSVNDGQPFLTADGKELWFCSSRDGGRGGCDLWRAVATRSGFLEPSHVPELSSSATDGLPVLTADRLTIYFSSARPGPGSTSGLHIWTSHRESVDDGFPSPTFAIELNSDFEETPAWISADNCRIYLSTNRGRAASDIDIYMATRQP